MPRWLIELVVELVLRVVTELLLRLVRHLFGSPGC